MWLTFQLGFQLDFPPLWLVIERCSVNRINWINTSVFIPQIIRRFLSDIYSYLCLYLVILFFFFFLVAAVVVAVVVVGLGFGYSRGCQGFFCAPPGFSRQWFRMLQSWFILNLFFLSFFLKKNISLSLFLSFSKERNHCPWWIPRQLKTTGFAGSFRIDRDYQQCCCCCCCYCCLNGKRSPVGDAGRWFVSIMGRISALIRIFEVLNLEPRTQSRCGLIRNVQ